jgi:hypothetical protein
MPTESSEQTAVAAQQAPTAAATRVVQLLAFTGQLPSRRMRSVGGVWLLLAVVFGEKSKVEMSYRGGSKGELSRDGCAAMRGIVALVRRRRIFNALRVFILSVECILAFDLENCASCSHRRNGGRIARRCIPQACLGQNQSLDPLIPHCFLPLKSSFMKGAVNLSRNRAERLTTALFTQCSSPNSVTVCPPWPKNPKFNKSRNRINGCTKDAKKKVKF